MQLRDWDSPQKYTKMIYRHAPSVFVINIGLLRIYKHNKNARSHSKIHIQCLLVGLFCVNVYHCHEKRIELCHCLLGSILVSCCSAVRLKSARPSKSPFSS